MKDERDRRDERGFSLIEVMIACVVLVFGLVSVVGVSVYVSRANSTSNTLNILAASAQDQVDRLRTAVWSDETEDATVSVGGALYSAPSPSPSPADTAQTESEAVPAPMAAGQDSSYTYTLDPDNPHRATVANTPAGDLRISWQVRQGPTVEIRYVTVKVEQVNAPPHLREGFTVTTILTRN